MTIQEADIMVANLLDEESADEFKHKLPAFYDYAQKQIATTVDYIEHVLKFAPEEDTEIDVKELLKENSGKQLYSLRKIIPSDSIEKIYGKIYKFSGGTEYKIICNVYPQTITEETDPLYEFEVSPEAQPAIAYYAAAQASVTDTDQRPRSAFMDMYNNILQNMSDAKRENVTLTVVNLGGNNGI